MDSQNDRRARGFVLRDDAKEPGGIRADGSVLSVKNQPVPSNCQTTRGRIPRFSVLISCHRFRRRDVVGKQFGDERYFSVRRYVDSVGRFEFSDQSAEFVSAENWNQAVFLGGVEEDGAIGCGLGGGFGNAATALYAANKLSRRRRDRGRVAGVVRGYRERHLVLLAQGRLIALEEAEIVEDVEPPLPLTAKMCLVKPSIGLSTPTIFKALDLNKRSTADPLDLLKSLNTDGCTYDNAINDLERPAFSKLPELGELKDKLIGRDER